MASVATASSSSASLSSSPAASWTPYRDRSAEFVALRKAAALQRQWLGQPPPPSLAPASTEPQRLSSDVNGPTGGNNEAPPSWVTAVASFKDLETGIQSRLDRLQSLHREFFAPRFRLPDAEKEEHDEIQRVTDEIRRLTRELERLVMTGIRLNSDTPLPEEVILAGNVKRHLSSRLTTQLTRFKALQQSYADLVKARDLKVAKFRTMGTSDEAQERVAKEEKVCQYLELGYSQVEIDELLQMEMNARETNSEVVKIVEAINELSSMFKEMHALIIEQGTMLDRIDYNIDKASVEVEKGINEMKKAREQQKKCVVQ